MYVVQNVESISNKVHVASWMDGWMDGEISCIHVSSLHSFLMEGEKKCDCHLNRTVEVGKKKEARPLPPTVSQHTEKINPRPS